MPDINKSYSWMIETCNAPNVGYSQDYRNQRTVNGITYYDCSSCINYSLLAGGFETPNYAPNYNAFTTYTEASVLLELGFTEVDATGEYLAGDIGLSATHTEMCYQGGQGSGVFMGAHTDNRALADQVSISNYTTSFPRLFRYGDGGASTYGSSIYVISALAGNAWRESHINPTLQQQGGGAFGLYQWDGERRDSLLTWLAVNGYSQTDANGQMRYLVIENEWMGTFDGISSLEEFLTSTSTDIASLTEAFCTCWERPGVPALNERINFANKAYNFIQRNAQNNSIKDWITDPMYYLSEEQALHNAVLMYRFYSAGGGGGGIPSKRKTKLPLYMMIRYF